MNRHPGPSHSIAEGKHQLNTRTLMNIPRLNENTSCKNGVDGKS